MSVFAASKDGGDSTSIGVELLAEELERGVGRFVHDGCEDWVGEGQ